MIEFAIPWAAFALPLPLLLRWLLKPAKQREDAVFFPRAMQFEATQHTRLGQPVMNRGWRRALALLLWCLLVLSATGPRWVGEPITLPATGRDLMLAVDISESMLVEDMTLRNDEVTRLTLVKAVVGDFVERRRGDRLGLILFGSNAYLHAPLSFDLDTIKQLLFEAQIGFAGKKTAIGDAIGIAIKRLRERPEGSRILILLTDGANTAGQIEPRQAADLAAASGLKIYTIGVGAEEMTVPGLFGSPFGSRTVNPSADLDEETLLYIAEATGGRYYRARSQSELAAIYDELDRLEAIEQDNESFRPLRSLHHWPLGAALTVGLLALAMTALSNRKGSPS